jgi:hypothetical protein
LGFMAAVRMISFTILLQKALGWAAPPICVDRPTA